MSQEKQTAEEMYNEHFKEEDTTEGYFIKSEFCTSLQEGIVLFAEEYATLKLQEQAKEIEELKEVLRLSEANYVGKNIELTKEIERLKGENELISFLEWKDKQNILTLHDYNNEELIKLYKNSSK